MKVGANMSPFSRQPPEVNIAPQKPCDASVAEALTGSVTVSSWSTQVVTEVWYWTLTSTWSSWTPRVSAQSVVASCQRSRTRNVPLAKSSA